MMVEPNDSIPLVRKDSATIDTIPLFYKDQFIPGDSIKWTSLGHQPSGFDGTPMPYRLRTDDGITGLLLFCFILTAYVFANGKKVLMEQCKNLFNRKEQTDVFSRTTSSDFRYRIILQLQTCILMGIIIFDYFHGHSPSFFEHNPVYLILGVYIGICILYYVIKWIIYAFIGWIFFDKNVITSWLESYSTIIHYLGFCFFPLTLLMIYFDLSTSIILSIGLILVILAKIVMFYKCLQFFFNNMYGVLYLIVYFCALEILPCFLLVQGLLQTNIILQIKL